MMNPPQPAPPPAPAGTEQLSLVQRIATLEDQNQQIFAMMKRDREYMEDLRARIGLS